MKVFVDSTLYVQKVDIEFLRYSLHVLNDDICNIINMDDYNKYDFISFTNKDVIDYLNGLDCIIDYQDIEHLKESEIREKGMNWANELENAASIIYQSKEGTLEYKEALQKYKVLNHLITSLTDIIDFKYGLLKLNMPKKKSKLKKLIQSFTAKKLL